LNHVQQLKQSIHCTESYILLCGRSISLAKAMCQSQSIGKPSELLVINDDTIILEFEPVEMTKIT